MRGMLGLSCESRADGLRQKWGRQSGIYSAMFIDILMFKALSLTTVSVRRLWVPSGVCPQSTDVPERLSAFPKLPLQLTETGEVMLEQSAGPTWSLPEAIPTDVRSDASLQPRSLNLVFIGFMVLISNAACVAAGCDKPVNSHHPTTATGSHSSGGDWRIPCPFVPF